MDRAQHDRGSAERQAHNELPSVTERAARTILRKLRDLDLRVRGLLVDADRCIRLEGCLSPDAPVEEGLAYRLRLADGSTARLELAWREGALDLALQSGSELWARRRIELVSDAAGRATAPLIHARLHPESCERRDVEHFLRRLVRAAFASA